MMQLLLLLMIAASIQAPSVVSFQHGNQRLRQKLSCWQSVQSGAQQNGRLRRTLTGNNPKCPSRDLSLSGTNFLESVSLGLPLVKADDQWGNWAVLSGSAALAQVLGNTTAVGRLLGPPVTAMALTFALATFGILQPGGTSAAKALQALSLQLATPLILLGADFRDASRRCGPLLLSFFAASLSTLIACLLGWQIVGPLLQDSLGTDGLIIAAALMAKNIGGGINYMAVCSTLGASSTAIAAGLCIDNIFALVYFPITSALASGQPDVVSTGDGGQTLNSLTSTSDVAIEATKPNDITVEGVSRSLFLSAFLLWIGELLGGAAGASLPVCTILTVLLASNAPSRFMAPLQSSSNVLGVVCLYLFFSTAGSPGLAVAESVKASILPLGIFLGILYSVHGVLLTVLNRVFGNRVRAFCSQRLLVASSAAIGGPATAVALAQSAGWSSLFVPGLLVGNIGYAVATFLGLGYHAYFR